jgi:hypothetical protein
LEDAVGTMYFKVQGEDWKIIPNLIVECLNWIKLTKENFVNFYMEDDPSD